MTHSDFCHVLWLNCLYHLIYCGLYSIYVTLYYRATSMLFAHYAVAISLSVCPSVCPSHAGIDSKLMAVSRSFHLLAQGSSFLIPSFAPGPRATLLARASNETGYR